MQNYIYIYMCTKSNTIFFSYLKYYSHKGDPQKIPTMSLYIFMAEAVHLKQITGIEKDGSLEGAVRFMLRQEGYTTKNKFGVPTFAREEFKGLNSAEWVKWS